VTTPVLDVQRMRELFDLQGGFFELNGGWFEDDPYPIWRDLRERGPAHPGTVHGLSGLDRPALFHGLPYPELEHFSVFSFEACDAAYRDDKVFSSSPKANEIDKEIDKEEVSALNSMLSMDGAQHRRYRSLVQPSFVPNKAQWWIRNWIEQTVHLLIDHFENEGRAELNVDFCAAIPVLTITGSFGVPVEQALDIREALHQPAELVEMIKPIVAARREAPEDDLISVLVEAEIKAEDGTTQRLSDPEIYSFAALLLAAGSGTTWKQMGTTLAALLERPDVLKAVTADRDLLRPAIEESLRWMPTDPMFSRWVTEDIDFFGTRIPRGAVVHICLGAANRDPSRWDDPDDYDIYRPMKPSLSFGNGAHICLGMHVARAEMLVGIGALLDRLPNLRLDPGQAPPRYVGFYERGASAIPVLFG
jgi:cytochrome P450